MHKYNDPKKQAIVDRAQAAIQQAEALKRDLARLVEITRSQEKAQEKPKESK